MFVQATPHNRDASRLQSKAMPALKEIFRGTCANPYAQIGKSRFACIQCLHACRLINTAAATPSRIPVQQSASASGQKQTLPLQRSVLLHPA